MKKTLYNYNDAHVGDTIYIIGSSPTLNDLTEEEQHFLKDKITIGANFSIEGVFDLSYGISAHISSAVYLFECGRQDMPVFVDRGSTIKKSAFSYMQDFFWNHDRIVEFASSPEISPGQQLDKKQNDEDVALRGWSSVLLLATHLAYIMSPVKIIYIGFTETSFGYYWNFNKSLENTIVKNIRGIMDSKKYWNNTNIDVPHNVHKEFECFLGDAPPAPCGQRKAVDISSEDYKTSYQPMSQQQNIEDFSRYITYLNSTGVETYTRSAEGITIEAGCKQMHNIL